ncbi:MAG: carbohydrate binding family 9 domain-containing protein [Bacteroidales bacterium]|nr:carbohydrate binding family 9 domain-containing protein [Bacteroidales bacterium]
MKERILTIRHGLLFLLAFCCSGINTAQETVKIKRINNPVEFNGIPDEDTWKQLSSFTLTMHRPDFGSRPSQESDIRIGYDDQFLWIGASLFMNDPSKIFAVSKKRDQELFDYDAFGVLLDTYNDNENGLAFLTTPTGLRTDYTISNDASGGGFGPGGPSFMNSSWNTFWDVKTSRDQKGWYVEMRIPFSSLKFKTENDIATMGLIIIRNISSNNETATWPAIDPRYGFMATNKPSLAGTIEIEGARPTKPVYVSPYLLAGFSRDWSLNEEGTAYVKDDNPKYDAGIDIKYNINSNLTLDLTGNTDFAQVEADDQQINLTRYSLFFPEKRKFFQERSSLFDFRLGGFSDNLFYSRRIGIAYGNPIRIYGGARLTGRLGKWDFGLLDMQTAEYEDSPSENFGVLRMRRQVINPNSFAGGIFTSRIGMDGSQNFAYGFDGIFRLFGDDYFSVKWAQSYDSKTDNNMASLDPSFILLDWERRSEKGFAYRLNYTYSGLEFNPGIGFVRMGGIQGFNGQLMYGWIPGEKSKLFNYNVNVRGSRYLRLSDGKLESMRISPGFEVNTKNGIRGEISMDIQEEGVLYGFNLSENIMIHPGNYSFTGADIRFGTSEARRVSLRGDANIGQFYDGRRIGFRAEPNLNLSASLNLSLSYEFNAIRFPERATNNSLDIHSVNLKALYMLSTKLSASLLVQYVNTEDDLITNFRLRYNPREGNDFYIVYNDYRGINRLNSIPELPGFFNKTIMVKYIHTFIF